jgi:hypothetical protein
VKGKDKGGRHFYDMVLYCVIVEGFVTNIIVLGSAVAVECVFLGGHDTISLQWASLWPETIKVLMLVKKKLHLVHVRGHPSVSLLPLSSPTLPLSICTPYPHLCIISKDRTYSRRPPSLMVQRLPRSRLTDSRRLPASPPARTSTASDGLRTHRDRSA